MYKKDNKANYKNKLTMNKQTQTNIIQLLYDMINTCKETLQEVKKNRKEFLGSEADYIFIDSINDHLKEYKILTEEYIDE